MLFTPLGRHDVTGIATLEYETPFVEEGGGGGGRRGGGPIDADGVNDQLHRLLRRVKKRNGHGARDAKGEMPQVLEVAVGRVGYFCMDECSLV